jgi:hypothetical protein
VPFTNKPKVLREQFFVVLFFQGVLKVIILLSSEPPTLVKIRLRLLRLQRSLLLQFRMRILAAPPYPLLQSKSLNLDSKSLVSKLLQQFHLFLTSFFLVRL